MNTFKLCIQKNKAEGKTLYYTSADELWRTYNSVMAATGNSLIPTIWVKSRGNKWNTCSGSDFAKFYLNNKRQIDITQETVNCTDELQIDLEKGIIEATWELWMDVDKYFGISTRHEDGTWINFYTTWHINKSITSVYVIDREKGNEVHEWELTEKEKKFILNKMEEYAMETEHLTLAQLYNSVKEYENIYESETKMNEHYLKRIAEHFISSVNPLNWNGNGKIPDNFSSNYNYSYSLDNSNTAINMVIEKKEEFSYIIGYHNPITGESGTDAVPLYCGVQEVINSLMRLAKIEHKEKSISFKGKDYPVGPLSKDVINRYCGGDNKVQGIVVISIWEMVNNNHEWFLDIISRRLVGSNMLANIQYKVIEICDSEANSVYLLVSGNVSEE